LDAEALELRIAGHQEMILECGLRGEDAIERVAMGPRTKSR
jgi:hypothetical protein